MALIAKNWNLSTYTNGAWTNLVDSGANTTLVRNVIVACGATEALIRIRTVDAVGTLLATIVPGETIDPNTGYKLDIALITLEVGQRLQVQASVAGVSFSANGAYR